jgi:hypothetical protein
MPSATTADNNDSIAPSKAMVNAGPTKDRTCAGSSEGSDNAGRVRGFRQTRNQWWRPLESKNGLQHGDHEVQPGSGIRLK